MLSATAGLFVPVNARAQKRRRIGALVIIPMDRLASHPVWIEFLDALRTYGWNEGNNLEIIARGTGGDQRKVPVLADELLSAGVELVLAVDTPSTEALLQRTRTVPIIFTGVADPVAAGLVSSLARPGGNATGLSNDLTDLNDKYVEFSRELVPGLRRLAVMFNPENQASARGFHRIETPASTFGVEVVPTPVASLEQLEPALAALARERPQVLIVHPALPFSLHTARIAEFAIRHGIAPLGNTTNQVRDGCLLSYGHDPAELFRRVAYYVDRILRGAAPRDLPVELTKVRLTINLATARALGVTVPASMLVRADEVIR
jgi:putative tryptophan/tyrosine transport system substrate-binding protein